MRCFLVFWQWVQRWSGKKKKLYKIQHERARIFILYYNTPCFPTYLTPSEKKKRKEILRFFSPIWYDLFIVEWVCLPNMCAPSKINDTTCMLIRLIAPLVLLCLITPYRSDFCSYFFPFNTMVMQIQMKKKFLKSQIGWIKNALNQFNEYKNGPAMEKKKTNNNKLLYSDDMKHNKIIRWK